ncbi:ATP-binding protein [Desulfofustis glycolicus]|uniref:Histidine kinase-, DNA gyrase B-, and HSP90-like ATPase n=1 Tax=Desulfofustis glycolicus DSM 9705 TaxID=1121409 RepID=A0A1M5XXQ5_9BACT|nr:ATP-binding protein [Desulfofustis glycolicus]SHI04611.1 Histidine kinase-, DNA gyrase B-, and HSP90-like ATPase [Desulfofustis glycolicus DSM 9705]
MSSKQIPLFEENFIRRTHSAVVNQPDIALTELVANCWDAGACTVTIKIPDERNKFLIITDDGVGMTGDEFNHRWRTLSYDRKRHQGESVEFPPGKNRKPRRAYGRNGVGRHAMFCFCDEYEVITAKNGTKTTFKVVESSGGHPFEIIKTSETSSDTHGTTLKGKIVRTLPHPEEMLEVLSARFMYDPEFYLSVNGNCLDLIDHSGLILQKTFEFADEHEGEVYVIDSKDSSRTKYQHGIAFWVGGRLVGNPSWNIGHRSLLDGRTKEAKRLTFIIKLDSLHDNVEYDWSCFRDSQLTKQLFDASIAAIVEILKDILSKRVEERTREVIDQRREEVANLLPMARLEVAEFTREVTMNQPFATTELIEAAVDALINLENSRSGQALIQKLSQMGSDDIAGLNKLLDEWTVRDALTVLDEVGRRIRIVEAIEKLNGDPNVDELHTLHPLVAQARWLFGPEYDSPYYISNVTLQTVIFKLTQKRVRTTGAENPRKRPDLLFLEDATISLTGVDGVNADGFSTLEKMLLLELKKGESTIGRAEMQQAEEYVEEIMHSSHIEGEPRIHAYVVGHKIDHTRTTSRNLDNRGFITACTYNQLVRTANMRLFSLRDYVEVRYPETADSNLIKTLAVQRDLLMYGDHSNSKGICG